MTEVRIDAGSFILTSDLGRAGLEPAPTRPDNCGCQIIEAYLCAYPIPSQGVTHLVPALTMEVHYLGNAYNYGSSGNFVERGRAAKDVNPSIQPLSTALLSCNYPIIAAIISLTYMETNKELDIIVVATGLVPAYERPQGSQLQAQMNIIIVAAGLVPAKTCKKRPQGGSTPVPTLTILAPEYYCPTTFEFVGKTKDTPLNPLLKWVAAEQTECVLVLYSLYSDSCILYSVFCILYSVFCILAA
ncbi:hypothetical protein KKE26_11635 [bacterium]|nr:hypothetical protein [bacterium]MBU1752254.1 hypothetical protein [bacterium]